MDTLLFNIMMVSDIDTLTSICLTHRNPWCDSNYFWKLKFEQDGLQLLSFLTPDNLTSWRHAYLLSSKIRDMIKYIDDHNKIAFDIHRDIVKILPKLSFLFSGLQTDVPFSWQLGIEYHMDDYIMHYFNRSIHINYMNLYDLLALIFYNDPNKIIHYIDNVPTIVRQAPRGRKIVRYEDL